MRNRESVTFKFMLMLMLMSVFCPAFVVSSVYAQDDAELDGEIRAGEIVIEKDRKIDMPAARKLYNKIKTPEFETEHLQQPSNFRSFDYNPRVQLPMLRAATPESTGAKEEIYDHYLKAGYGNFASALLQADLNLITDKSRVLRANLAHLSFGSGAKDGENSASAYTAAGINAVMIGQQLRLTTGLNYATATDYFYGYRPGLEINRDDIKHKYHFFDASLGIADSNEDNALDYHISAGFNSTKDNIKASESGFDIGLGFSYAARVFLDGRLMFSRYKQSNINQRRNFIEVRPFYRIETGRLMADAGFSFTAASGGTEAMAFPYLSASYALSDRVRAFAVLDGGIQFNAYRDYAIDNPYLQDDIAILNSKVNYDAKAGVNIKASERVAAGLYGQVKSVRGLANDVNVLPDTTTFDIVYIPGPTTVLELGADLAFNINEDHELDLSAALLSYSSEEVDAFYHLPTARVEAVGHHTIADKLTLRWQFNMLGGLKGLQSNGTTAGNESVKGLSAITELNIHLDYPISERLGAFLQFINLLNKNYERYLNYPMRGVQAKAGVSLSLN